MGIITNELTTDVPLDIAHDLLVVAVTCLHQSQRRAELQGNSTSYTQVLGHLYNVRAAAEAARLVVTADPLGTQTAQ